MLQLAANTIDEFNFRVDVTYSYVHVRRTTIKRKVRKSARVTRGARSFTRVWRE